MESATLELLRALQSGPYDESGWKNIRITLRGQRRYLRAQQDLSTLSDLVQLLETWALQCDNPRIGADALREAADIAERELHRDQDAAELRKRALAHSHGTGAATPTATRDRARPERALARDGAGTPQAQQLGEHRTEADDVDGAIEAYERALSVEADMDVVYKLAELYAKRGGPGDAQQSADLFCTLGDVLGNPAGIPMLQRALEQVPDHVEARSLFQQYGGATAMAPAPPSIRPRRITRPQTSRSPEPPHAAAAKPPRIATHQTVAGLGPPSPAATATGGPILQSSSAGARSLLKPGGGRSPTSRRTRTPRTGALVAPQPHGPIGSGALPLEPPPKAAEEPADFQRSSQPQAAAWNDPTGAPPAEDPVTATSPTPGKSPPPLKSAKERARELQPIPQGTPVITIMQPQQASTPPVAPVTSLSPVVVDDGALERSRGRLEKSRQRKRKVLGATLAATAAAAIIVVLVAPRSMDDAQRMAARVFGSESTTTTTSTASQPPAPVTPDPVEPTKPQSETPSATPSPAAATPDPAQAKTPEPTQPTTPEPAAATPAPAQQADDKAETKAEEPPPPPSPTVNAQLEQATVRGGKLTEAQLSAAVAKVGPKLANCYAEALEKKPRLKGRLVLAWTVRPTGKVAGAKKQGGTIKDAELIRCSIGAIATTRFPKPKKQAAQVKLAFDYKR